MKKLLPVIFLLACLPISAQIAIGVKGGPSLSFVETKSQDFYQSVPTINFHAGGFIHKQFKSHASLGTEILYSVKGFHRENIPSTITFHYLSVPFLMGYTIGPITLHLGPEISYLLSSYEKVSDQKQDLAGDKPIDLAALLDAKWQISSSLALGFRYVHSYMTLLEVDFFDDEGQLTGSDFVVNRNLQVSLYYAIGSL